METPYFINRRGHILSGSMAGFDIYVQDDEENTGGYLILFTKPGSTGPGSTSIGYDDWVEKEELGRYFNQEDWQINWDV